MFQRKVNAAHTTNGGVNGDGGVGGSSAGESPLSSSSPHDSHPNRRQTASGAAMTTTSTAANMTPSEALSSAEKEKSITVEQGSAMIADHFHNGTTTTTKGKKRSPNNGSSSSGTTQFRNIFLPLYHHPYNSKSSSRRRRGQGGIKGHPRHPFGSRLATRLRTQPLMISLVPICLVVFGGIGMIWMSLRMFYMSSSSSDSFLSQKQHTTASFELTTSYAPVCTPITSVDDISVTLVTQLSQDRLWMMEHHCNRYVNQGHHMSIAVYSNNTQEQVLEMLRQMDCPVDVDEVDNNEEINNEQIEERDGDDNEEDNDEEQQQRRHRRRHLLEDPSSRNKKPLLQVAVLDAQTHGKWNDYPVNELRNLALRQVDTSYIIYIDVDFWPSDKLYETIVESPDVQTALMEDPQRAIVIPAFSLMRQCTQWKECPNKNIPKMPRSMSDLAMGIKKKRVTIFDPTNKGGHGSTDYKAYVQQTSGSLHDISCLQSHRYEPFVMIRYCRDLPPFQEVFSGYGKNKVTWMMQVVASGYVFSQVGGAYLVHYPHLDSHSRQHWNEAPKQLQVPMTSTDQQKRDNGMIPPQEYFNLRRPKKTDRGLHLASYKRGQVDQLYLEFRKWLQTSIPSDKARLPVCEDVQTDDGKLWIDPELREEEKEQEQKRQQQKVENLYPIQQEGEKDNETY